MATSVAEFKTIRDKIQDYFKKLNLNLISTANPLPSFEDYSKLIIYDSLLTDALLGTDRAASFSNGALVDAVHLASAITREFGMRSKTKASYLFDARDDTFQVTEFMQMIYGKYLNYFRGTSPEQGKE